MKKTSLQFGGGGGGGGGQFLGLKIGDFPSFSMFSLGKVHKTSTTSLEKYSISLIQ